MTTINAIYQDDLKRPSSVQKYDLGARFIDHLDLGVKSEYVYVKAGSALNKYQPYQLSISNVIGGEFTTKSPVNYAAGAVIIVPQTDVATGDYVWAKVKGASTVLTTDTFAAGDYAEILSGGTGFVLDGGASGATVEGAGTVGIATTGTSGGMATFLLGGNTVSISAT